MGLLNNKLKDKKTIAVFFGLFIFVTLMGYQTKNSDLSSLYKSYIENQIAEVLGLTAEIGEFEIDWLDSSPLIIIDRLDLRRSDLQTNILLENLVLSISLSESFLNMQIIISDFSVDGISLGLNTFSGRNQLDVYGTLELEKSENFQRALHSFFDATNLNGVAASAFFRAAAAAFASAAAFFASASFAAAFASSKRRAAAINIFRSM